MDFDGNDLRTQRYEDVLDVVDRALNLQLDRASGVFGTQGATVGFPTSNGTWVRVAWRRIDRIDGQAWTGAECASAIPAVRKPELYRSHRWVDSHRAVVWRADETELVTSNAVHPAGVLDDAPDLADSWWNSLKTSLTALGDYETDRVGMRQSHLSKRINQVFGDREIDTTIDQWTTAHADLHWGNLTAPDCYLLDWEDWGAGPRGLDAATLWGVSLRVPSIADRVQVEFADDLRSRSGRIAQLLFCANVIRVSRGKPTQNPLVEPASREADRLIEELRSESYPASATG